MYLKFIGHHGSMGLAHGCLYRVKVFSYKDNIWVKWRSGWIEGSRYSGKCPYSSPSAFASNWSNP